MRAALLALCLVLAGCGGAVGPGDSGTPSPTVTPVSVPADPTPVRPPALRDGLDVRALAQGHADALAGESYRWRVYVERPDRTADSDRRVVDATTVHVESPTRYRSARSRTVLDTGIGVRITLVETYANGERAYTRVRNRRLETVGYEAREARLCAGGEGPTLDAAESAIVQYLSVREADVTAEQTRAGPRFRVRGRDATHPSLSGVRDYRVEALVTPDGVVTAVTATYVRPTGGGVAFETAGFEYTTFDAPAVTPPRWYTRAQVATEGLALPATVAVGGANGTEAATGDGTESARSTPAVVGAVSTGGCGGFDCETFPGGEAVGAGRCEG